MLKNQKKRLDFLPNKLNKYSIRKFTVGTASILVGATLFLGVNGETQAAEKSGIATEESTTEAGTTEESTTEAGTTEEST
ncbi:YSIRK-type signal peptide-containing protein, partial [Staphylococcus borealis]|uniref:YSIRK-type signal peptide-containing protein n=1 Tax=Staphylococcus borealis TaxID=2742203 RepID=UPI0039ECBDED